MVKKIINNTGLFYLLQFTWGLAMNIIGALVFAFLIIFRKKQVKKYHSHFYIVVGKTEWGGLNLGLFFLVDKTEHLVHKYHEAGHGLQNIVYGPLFPFLVAIPSAIRYHYRNYRIKKGLGNKNRYSDIWFEKQADEWGFKYYVAPYLRQQYEI